MKTTHNCRTCRKNGSWEAATQISLMATSCSCPGSVLELSSPEQRGGMDLMAEACTCAQNHVPFNSSAHRE